MTTVTDEDKLAEVKREIAFRNGVYRKRSDDGRLSTDDARRIAVMEAIRDDYLRKIAPGLDLGDLAKATAAVEARAGRPVSPLVLYPATEEDREEIIEAFTAAKPNMRTVRL